MGSPQPSQVILNMLSVLTVELAKELVYWLYAVCLRNLSSSKLLHPHTGSTDNILGFQSSQIKHSRLTESPSKITSWTPVSLAKWATTSIALASISSATSGGPNLIWTARKLTKPCHKTHSPNRTRGINLHTHSCNNVTHFISNQYTHPCCLFLCEHCTIHIGFIHTRFGWRPSLLLLLLP